MMQLTFDKYTITGTAQELADYVSAYESKQVNLVDSGYTSVSTTISANPSGL